MANSMEYKSFFKTVGGNEGSRCKYSTRLDRYGCGCSHNCAYCYAKSLLDFRGLWHPGTPAVADIEKVRKTIARKLRPGDVVRLGGMTDCFMPIERKFGVTRETIKALNDRGVHYLIVTKSPLVAEYADVLDEDLCHVQFSITSTDAGISRRIEPGAALPEERIAACEFLASRRFDVAVRLSPFVPEFVDLDRIARIGCNKILVEFLRVNNFIGKWLDGVDLSGHTYKHAGYRHLPLEAKIELLKKVKGFMQMSVCEDVPEHWEYWREKFNANPDDCCNLRIK